MAKLTKVNTRIVSVPVDSFEVDLTKNVRDPSGKTYNLDPLQQDVFQHGGLKVRPLFHFVNGEFDQIIQGNRRTLVYKRLHKEIPHDKRWDNIEVEVVEGLTPAEIMSLKRDQGNTQLLQKHEVVREVWMSLDAEPGITEKQLILDLQSSLSRHWPLPQNKKTDDEIAGHYRGTIQNIKNGWRLPRAVGDLPGPQATYLALVEERGAVAYRKKDIDALVKLFEAECRENPMFNKDNAGPKFQQEWDKFLKGEDERAETGNKPKAVASMSKKELEAVAANTTSFLVKMLVNCATRTTDDADRKLKILGDCIVRDVEPLLNDTVKANLNNIFKGDFKAAGF